MIWALVAAGLAAGVDWRRLGILSFAVALPLPAAILLGAHWWRERPDVSMRAPRFCDAISTELRAGASFRSALETAAHSVEASELVELIRLGAPMGEIALAAGAEFSEIGQELVAVLARSDGMGVAPAALFDELGNLALAQVEVAHEVATASAPARATAVVLLVAPIATLVVTANRGFDAYLAQPAQRAAALLGMGLTIAGLVTAVMILRRPR